MEFTRRAARVTGVTLLALGVWPTATLPAQTTSYLPPGQPVIGSFEGYVVGPNDVLTIAYDGEPSMTGKFTVGSDHTITYPLIGRVLAAGRTLSEIQEDVQTQLTTKGFYIDPQIAVSVEEFRPQSVSIVGKVNTPGTYALSGTMRLFDALAAAGSTRPTAGAEAVIVPAESQGVVVHSSSAIEREALEAQGPSTAGVTRIRMESGLPIENVRLHDGDTVFILRAESIYLVGEVGRPGAYTMRQDTKTILQGIALGGGITGAGAERFRSSGSSTVNGRR